MRKHLAKPVQMQILGNFCLIHGNKMTKLNTMTSSYAIMQLSYDILNKDQHILLVFNLS